MTSSDHDVKLAAAQIK